MQGKYLNTSIRIGSQLYQQLTMWRNKNIIAGLPAIEKIKRTQSWKNARLSLEKRSQFYLDTNCAHCHNKRGSAYNTKLFLSLNNLSEHNFGICKKPQKPYSGNAGKTYIIHPGLAHESALFYRINSEQVYSKMPPIARHIRDNEGLQLIKRWINSMENICHE